MMKLLYLIFTLALLVGCADYVQQIDDRYSECDASLSSEAEINGSNSAKSSNSVNLSSSSISQSSSSAKSMSSCSVMNSSSSAASGTVEETNGIMVDSRDGQTYKTVTIGSQTWMAENLNFKTDSSFCYNNEESYCTKYGRLYRWAAAVGKSESECGFGYTCSFPSGNIQGVCPSGWHLPSKNEWETLFNAISDSSTVGKVLKSISGWNRSGDGTDDFGFSALPAGYRFSYGSFASRDSVASYYVISTEYNKAGYYAFFWSSTEYYMDCAYYMSLGYDERGALLDYYIKYYGFSVRCLQD